MARILAIALIAAGSLLRPHSAAGERFDDLDNSAIEGTIRDSTGALVTGAHVLARNQTTGVETAVPASPEGRYRISITQPGVYSIKATASGFRDEEHSDIQVVSGRRVTVDLTLTPAGVSEQATVVASATPLIDTTRTVVGDTIGAREIDELPIVNRDPLQLVFLMGGVTDAPLSTADLADEGAGVFLRGTPEEAGLFSLTGAPATSNNLTIDGLDNNDDRTARERISLNPESIAEVQIITNQYAAEYGRASGGRINLRTRGGGNRLGGDAYGFFGDESLNANSFFRNARGLGRIPQQEIREGVVISGPIRADRDFFFGGYERLDLPDSAEVDAIVPVRSNPAFPLPAPNRPAAPGSEVAQFIDEIRTPETRNLFNGRVDFNFTQLHNASFRADAVLGANKRGFPGGTRLPDSIAVEGRNSESVSITDNLILSAKFVNQFRFQYSRLKPRRSADLNSTAIVIEDPFRITAGAFTGSDSSPAFTRREDRNQFQDTVSLLFGGHMLKTGADVQLVGATFTDLFATGGEYTFATVSDFLSNAPRRFVQRFDTESRQSNNVLGFFFQDEWKIQPNLTMSYGMRWDNESIVEDRDNFSPRLAIAWDPFGGKLSRSKGMRQPGRTVVRAGFGLFYNRALLRTIDDFSLGRSTLIVDSDIEPDVLRSVHFPSPLTDRSAIERFGISETEFLRRVSPDLEIPYTVQTGLGIERQITRTMVVGIDYIFTRGVHLWRETNVNAPALPPGFATLTEFLTSRDFDNRAGRDGSRPITGANADVVRFTQGTTTSTSAGAISVVNGLRIVSLGLNAPRSSNITAALRAINFLRPDPSLTQVEQLESTGSSFYNGMIVSVRQSLGKRATFRATYTLSKYVDEGTTNTASPQNLVDRRAERAISLQDQRHRMTFSGTFSVPQVNIDLSPTVVIGSSRPFNIGSGVDRNLNDIQNDRPNFTREIGRPEWRRPGDAGDAAVKEALVLSPIGSDGNLPRNYGIGPGTRGLNLRASRTFSVSEHVRVRPAIDVFNVLNATIFSFGSEFINRDDSDFLTARRTQRPRIVQLGVKVSF